MASPLDTVFRPLVRRFGEAASKAKPFYSGVDQAISAITQNKGTGQQMLAEILKTKGAAKELKDRPVVRAALNQPKITKEQLQKIATDNPAPQFTEKTRGEGAFEAEVDRRAAEMKRFRVNEIMDEMNPDGLPQSAAQRQAARQSAENVVQDEEKQIRQNVVDVLHDEDSFYTKYEDRTIPGGTNDREILFQLPLSKDKTKNFDNPHYPESNILAHARVSDRFEPNGDKALHVEELQSDLHQRARDIRKKEIKRLIDSGVSKADANKQVPVEYGYGPRIEKTVEAYYETKSGQRIPVGYGKTKEEAEASIDVGWKNLVDIKYETFDKKVGEGVPDSPFKENWHEVAMKRLLDDAVKNGYKKVYITPGAEQAKRYNLAKYISKIEYEKQPNGTYHVIAITKNGDSVLGDMYKAEELPNIVGKDVSARIFSGDGIASEGNNYKELSGIDLKLGGEGMIGFYDKMVPSFVNDYGAPYNMRMNLHDTPVGGNKYTVFEDSNPSPFSVVREGGSAIASRHGTREEAEAAAAELSTQPLHSIAITPEFEAHVQEKGQRLYQAIPAGIGIGAEALTEEEPAPMKKGGPVSLDAMRLAVMNKKVQHKQYGGALKSGISRIRKNMNPVSGNTIIKEGGGNWIGGDVERGLKGLKRNETPVLPITEAEVTAMRNAGYTVYDPVTGTYTKPNPINQFVDKQLTKYVKNQMGTKDDPVRLAADAFPAQKAKLLAEKQVQIDKATADMEKAQQSRGFTPEMMTRSQARIRTLEIEKDLIARRVGLHYEPQGGAVASFKARQQAGFPVDPVSTTPYGQAWENISDAAIEVDPYRMRLPMVTPETAPDALRELGGEFAVQNPNAVAYSIKGGHLNDVVLGRSLGFNHMMDELRNATNIESGLPKELLIDPKNLSKWTMPQVTEHVDKINAWRAAQKAEADVARANNAATVLHKDYPEKGMKWVELKAPEGEKPADWDSYTPAEKKNYLSFPNSKGKAQLADALKYEGELMQHCVGGYCDDVISGRSRIFSLRDAKGNPHATIEVVPHTEGYTNLINDDVASTIGANQIGRINQIKGMNDRIPKEEYLPYVQDFVRSGKWSDVKDLQNTGLFKHESGKYVSQDEANALAARHFGVNETNKPDMTESPEIYFNRMSRYDPEMLSDTDKRFIEDWKAGNFKRGGVVHMDKGGTPENIFGVAETPEQEFLRYVRMLRVNASGGKDPYGADVGGRFGINIPLSQNVSIEPYFQGSANKPNSGKVERGGIAGANLNIRFNNGGAVSDDAMRMAVMNKQLRKHHG